MLNNTTSSSANVQQQTGGDAAPDIIVSSSSSIGDNKTNVDENPNIVHHIKMDSSPDLERHHSLLSVLKESRKGRGEVLSTTTPVVLGHIHSHALYHEQRQKVAKLRKALLEIIHEDHEAANPESVNAMYATPGQLIELIAKGGVHKAHLTIDQLLILGFMAGCFVGLGGLISYSVTGDSPFLAANPGISRFVFGMLFPIALVLIILTGSELYTGNSFTLVPALLNRQINMLQFAKNWICVYISNILGAVFVAYFLGYWAAVLPLPKHAPNSSTTHSSMLLDSLLAANSTIPSYSRQPPWASALIHSVQAKTSKTFYVQFLQGIGANWCVCLAVYCAYAARDVVGKMIGSMLPVAIFVCLQWEHCIANSFLIPLGMFYDAPGVTFGKFAKNMFFVTCGNTVAGVFLIGLPYWYVYHFRETHHEMFYRLFINVLSCCGLRKGKKDKHDDDADVHMELHDDHEHVIDITPSSSASNLTKLSSRMSTNASDENILNQ